MSPLNHFLCAAIALGYFTIRGHAVEPTPPPTSDRSATLANAFANLEAKCFRDSWLEVTSNAVYDLGRPKPLVGAWFHNPEAQPLVAAIIAFGLIYGGTSVISRGLPVFELCILKGATSKVIGILMLVLGIITAILAVDMWMRGSSEGIPNTVNPF